MTSGSRAPGSSARSLTFVLFVSSFLLGITIFWLFRGRWLLGIAQEWTIQPNVASWPLISYVQPLGVLCLFGGLAAWSAYDRFRRARSRREQTASTTLSVAALTLLALVWPLSLLGPIGTENLINATWSDVANEYFGTAYQVEDARAFTREYSSRWQQPESALQAHVATHPPGAVLFYLGAQRIFESAPAVRSVFTGLAEELTGEPLNTVAAQANALRRTAGRVAGAKQVPTTLPGSAVAVALWSAFLISLALAAAVPAVYLLASSHSRETNATDSAIYEARGLIAAALFVLAPSTGLFAFTLDALITAGAAWTLAFVARRLAGGKIWWMIAAGISLGLTSFLSFGALAVGAIVALAVILAYLANPSFSLAAKLRHILREAVLFAIGFGALWLLLLTVFPMQPLSIFSNAVQALRLATLSSRSYGSWAWMNIIMFALFCGWPLALLLQTRGLQMINLRRGRDRDNNPNGLSIAEMIGWAAVLTLILLTLSGNVRGEVERLWLFLIPPLCALAASVLQPTAATGESLNKVPARSGAAWGMLLVLQTVQTILMAATLAPLVRPF